MLFSKKNFFLRIPKGVHVCPELSSDHLWIHCGPRQDHTIVRSWKFPLECHSAFRNFLPLLVQLEVALLLKIGCGPLKGRGMGAAPSAQYQPQLGCERQGPVLECLGPEVLRPSCVINYLWLWCGWVLIPTQALTDLQGLPSCSDPQQQSVDRSLLIHPDDISIVRERILPLPVLYSISRNFMVKLPGPKVVWLEQLILLPLSQQSTPFSDSPTLCFTFPLRDPVLSLPSLHLEWLLFITHTSIFQKPQGSYDLIIQSIFFLPWISLVVSVWMSKCE